MRFHANPIPISRFVHARADFTVRRTLTAGTSMLALLSGIALPSAAAKADTILPLMAMAGPVNGLGTGGFMVLGGSVMTVLGANVSNFTAVGGNGSGGGGGLGGAIFVGTGSTLTVTDSTFSQNYAKGGQGGVGTTGGGLNAGGLLGALIPPIPTALPGLPGVTFSDNSNLFGDGSGNGLAGTNGHPGGNAVLIGPGMPGGAGGNGQSGWSNNPGMLQAVSDATTSMSIATQAVSEAVTGSGIAASSVTASILALSVSTANLAADTAGAISDAASASEFTDAATAASTAAVEIAKIAIDSTDEAGAVIGEVTAQTAAGLATAQEATANQALTLASQQLTEATNALSAWEAANVAGSVGQGGAGGNGGASGAGGFGLPGGVGANGGNGGAAGGGAQGGIGGAGGAGGTGGFGAGGSSGGNGGSGGLGVNPLLGSGDAGAAGPGGGITFGGGVGSTGTGYEIANSQGGGGGAGLGGAIFIQSGGIVFITGNTTFSGNTTLGGGSTNGGVAGGTAGNDIFLQGNANVNLVPGPGNTISFLDHNAIADDSSAGVLGTSQTATGQGGSVTLFGGGLVVFAPGTANTYTGTTSVGGLLPTIAGVPVAFGVPGTGTELRANDGDGLPTSSLLQLAGAGVLETSGTFSRYVGTPPVFTGQVQWAGSGGFAAVGGPLIVTLNNGAALNWGLGGFVPNLSTLVLGAGDATDTTTFSNNIQTLADPLNVVSITVVPNLAQPAVIASPGILAQAGIAANADTAIYTGVISGLGSFSVNDVFNNGVLQLTGTNTYYGPTFLNGGTMQLIGSGGIANSIQVNITNATATLDIAGTTSGASIAGLAGLGTVNLGSQNLTIANALTTAIWDGTIQGSGAVTISAGQQTFGGNNTYTGVTTIGAPATLALTGVGSIAASAGVVANGTFDISGTSNGASITTLSGTGYTYLGGQTLTLTAANGTFAGNISDGGLTSGAPGNLTIAGGTETLTGTNYYTGNTTTNTGATLALSGTGSIATSAQVVDNGLFDISATTTGSSIITLMGGGAVNLGTKQLTVTDGSTTFAGVIHGAGPVVIAGGTQTLSGTNTYTGTTTIDSGATLALTGTGGIATSAQVIDNGLFNISSTSAGASITTLSGNGHVHLGAEPLTFSAGSTTFAGQISGQGAVVAAGGVQTLTGTNTYTGATTIDAGASLVLFGNGSIANAAQVADNGTLDISGTNDGAYITTLSGTGTVSLGGVRLRLSSADGTFGGVIADGGLSSGTGGGVSIEGGAETFTGNNTYTGSTYIAAGTDLYLSGTGSIATSSYVSVDGSFVISNTTSGASIEALYASSGAGVVSLGAQTLTLTGTTSGQNSFAGIIQGSGGIIQAGGTQMLSGNNTYTGPTTVNNNATLILGGTNAYTGATTIDSGGALALVGNGAIAYSSGVADNGTFDISETNAGASIVTLSGSGGVTLGNQPLTLSNAASTFAGSIGGAGSFNVAAGYQTLTGTSTYTGGTTVGTGAAPSTSTIPSSTTATLAISGGGAIGTGALTLNNGTLVATTVAVTVSQPVQLLGSANVFNTNSAATTLTLSNVISGTGAMTAAGGGTLSLSGTANTYSGGTTVVEDTTLKVASNGSLGAPNAPLVVASGSQVIAEGDLSSDRPITLFPGATINANGYTVDLNPAQVTLVSSTDTETLLFSASQGSVEGPHLTSGSFDIAGNVLTVDGSATLVGVGTVSAYTDVNGTLWPGNSPGTLTFTAPLVLSSSATYAVNIDGTGTGTGAGNYSRILMTGTGNTFTAGGVIVPILRGITGSATNTYTPPVTTTFDVVNAAAGVVGSFASLTQPASGLPAGTRFDALYTPNDITLVVTPASYQDLSAWSTRLTYNQTQVGMGIDALRGAAGVRNDPAATAALGVLFQQQPQNLPMVFDSLAGTIYGDSLMASLQRGRAFGGTISDRQAAMREGVGSPNVSLADGGNGVTTWMSATGQNTSVGGNGNTGYSDASGGFAAGADKQIRPNLSLGFAVGSSFGTVSSSDTGAKDDLTTTMASLYGAWTFGTAFVDVQGGLNFGDSAVRRAMPVYGTAARSNADGAGADFSLDAGRVFQAGGFQLTPMAGIRIDQASRGALTESDAGALSLAVKSGDAVSALGTLGGRTSKTFAVGRGYAMTVTGRLFYAHEFADDNTVTTAAFSSGMQDVPMSFRTAPTGRDGVLGGLGLDLQTPSKAVTVFVDYGADARSNSTSQAASGGVRITW